MRITLDILPVLLHEFVGVSVAGRADEKSRHRIVGRDYAGRNLVWKCFQFKVNLIKYLFVRIVFALRILLLDCLVSSLKLLKENAEL